MTESVSVKKNLDFTIIPKLIRPTNDFFLPT